MYVCMYVCLYASLYVYIYTPYLGNGFLEYSRNKRLLESGEMERPEIEGVKVIVVIVIVVVVAVVVIVVVE
jgi:hypothetical protein